jgi:hypothetical protein
MDNRTPSDVNRLKLRRHIEKICKLCSDVLEGYSSHCQERYGHPVRQRNLDKIRLLYEQRIERRCAEYNLTILEEKQWEQPSNLKISDDGDSGDESEEHDSDVVDIYTSSDDDEDDDEEDDPIGEPVLLERVYKGFRAGDSYDSYDRADLSDVSVPSDEEGKEKFLSECTLQAHNDRTDRNREYSLGVEWPQYEEFGRKVMLDERIRNMKRDRIEQLRSRAYGAALSHEEKADFWNVHNWWQSLGEDEKQAEKNSQDTQREISKRSKKS